LHIIFVNLCFFQVQFHFQVNSHFRSFCSQRLPKYKVIFWQIIINLSLFVLSLQDYTPVYFIYHSSLNYFCIEQLFVVVADGLDEQLTLQMV